MPLTNFILSVYVVCISLSIPSLPLLPRLAYGDADFLPIFGNSLSDLICVSSLSLSLSLSVFPYLYRPHNKL